MFSTAHRQPTLISPNKSSRSVAPACRRHFVRPSILKLRPPQSAHCFQNGMAGEKSSLNCTKTGCRTWIRRYPCRCSVGVWAHVKGVAADAGEVVAVATGEVGAVAAPVRGPARAPVLAAGPAALRCAEHALQRPRRSIVRQAVHCTPAAKLSTASTIQMCTASRTLSILASARLMLPVVELPNGLI